MSKSNYLKYTATLAIICLAASGLLTVVYNLTRPKILYQQALEEQESLKEVIPQAQTFEPVKEADTVIYYKALDKEQHILGYAFKTSKKGYSSDIVTMVGINPKGEIINIKILSQNETPGLGMRVTEVIQKNTLWDILFKKVKIGPVPKPWFAEQFSGKKVAALDRSIDTITGATISSRAVIDSIKIKAKEIIALIKND